MRSGILRAWVQISALVLSSCVTPDKPLHLSEPPFPFLQNDIAGGT